MRVYFLSGVPAVLKLNGIFSGTVDGFERHVSLDPSDRVFAEILPGDNLQPVNFFLDEKFFAAPPPFADLYFMDGDALIYIREYSVKDVKLNVIYQTRFNGNLITIFSQGGVYVSLEGADYTLKPLPDAFSKVSAKTQTIDGRQVLAIYGGDELLIISENAKIIFLNRIESAEFNEKLYIRAPFETCAAAKAECVFGYDGENLALISSKTIETRTPDPSAIQFAFFESVLTRGDYQKYLDDGLLPKAGELKNYLGDYVSVTVPTEKFYTLHGKIAAAGLVYPKSENVYLVKYYAVDVTGGKISNIYPVE